jgi:hypothetical protein
MGEKKGTTTEAGDVADNYYQDGKIADEAVVRLSSSRQNPSNLFC